MSTLLVKFEKYTADSGSAKIAFDLIDEQLQRVPQAPIFITLGSTTDIEVEPGAYLVKAQLPNGETMTAQTIVKSNQIKEVILVPQLVSPRESLSWAYYLKKTSRRGNPIYRSNPKEQELVEPINLVRLQPQLTLFEINATPFDFRLTDLFGIKLKNVPNRLGAGRVNNFIQFDWNPMQESTKPDLLGQISISDLDNYPSQLCICVSVMGSINKYIMLPPFNEVMALIIQENIDKAYKKYRDTDPFHVVMSSNNPTLESLLSYLTNGDFQSIDKFSEQVLELAEHLLKEKKKDVMGAVIGGYVLLKSSNLSRLHDWTSNLANWFPDIPDTAVIRGWHLLKKEQPDPLGAFQWFIQAVSKGIPYYTLGLRLLYDGLSLFRSKDSDENGLEDPILRKALNKLQPFVAIADWEQPITTLSGWNDSSNPFKISADLTNVDIPQFPFQEVVLKGKNLQNVKQQGANLQGADLQGANLQEANLQEANLEEADLQGANLQGADLQLAKLIKADLHRADMRLAKMKGADLTYANLQGANLQGADLRGVKLYSADLRAAKLQDADLTYAYLTYANLPEAKLQGTNLTFAYLKEANLQGADLQGVNLQGAKLQGANLQGAKLQGANLISTEASESHRHLFVEAGNDISAVTFAPDK